MDERTADFYAKHAAEIANNYQRASSAIDQHLAQAFSPGMRVLDIGAGSGRDMDRLLDMGCDVFGVEPCAELRAHAIEKHPRLRSRLSHGALPDLGKPSGGQFGGVLCSAVLMHLPCAEVFDAAVAIRSVLEENGRLLLSIPDARPSLSADHRDEHGRLYTRLAPDYLELLFERLGFDVIGRWHAQDGLGRPGYSWYVLLFQIRHVGTSRPLDQIEGILNRDRKTATYKLALFRALSEIAVTQFEQTRWRDDGMVAVPLDIVAERWLHYFWPIVASPQFIPQIRGESQECAMPIAFRSALTRLVSMYQKTGGLPAFALDHRSGRLSGEVAGLLSVALKQIRDTIVKGPVTYAGGALETGRMFAYDARGRQTTMSASIWRELSLLGHWIQDAAVLRRAELTSEISKEALRPSQVIDLLLTTPIAERDVRDAKEVYRSLTRKECVWTGAPLHTRFGVDHIIPFSLWHNNDLWNLVPALPAINSKKSDRLPTRDLMIRRQDCLVHYWHVLREAHGPRFDYELCRVIGEGALPPRHQHHAPYVRFLARNRGRGQQREGGACRRGLRRRYHSSVTGIQAGTRKRCAKGDHLNSTPHRRTLCRICRPRSSSTERVMLPVDLLVQGDTSSPPASVWRPHVPARETGPETRSDEGTPLLGIPADVGRPARLSRSQPVCQDAVTAGVSQRGRRL